MSLSRRHLLELGLVSGAAGPLISCQGSPRSAGRAWRFPSRIPALTSSGGDTTIEAAGLRELAESLQGMVLLEGDFGYDGARSIWNAQHDRRPAMIVRPTCVQDVANAVTFARERQLLLAVKGGGHSWPGHSVADGALMIDLSPMSSVLVDPERRRARAGGGALLLSLDLAAQRHGLATTAGVVSHTGVGGLTLGGGYGRLNRKYGLTIDNLVSARMVTADGEIRRVSADENPDLFWAIRGGGGNFGVVTEFEYRLHEVGPIVIAGAVLWPIAEAKSVLTFYAEYSTGLSDELYTGPFLVTIPGVGPVIGMDVLHCGDAAAAERELAPLRTLGEPVADDIAAVPYLATQTKDDTAWRSGLRSYAKNGIVREFTEPLIDAIVESYDPAAGVFLGTHTAGGAVARVGETDTAWPHRNAAVMFVMGAAWENTEHDDKYRAATRRLYSAIEPFAGGYYANIESEVENASGNYGPVHARLVAVKNAHDPTNLFRLNSNIRPTV